LTRSRFSLSVTQAVDVSDCKGDPAVAGAALQNVPHKRPHSMRLIILMINTAVAGVPIPAAAMK